MPTATSATERVVSDSSTRAERKAVRSVVFVARRYASPSVRTRAAGPRSRPSATSVGSPATRSRTWALSRCIESSRSAELRWVIQPTSAMNSGTSGSVTAISSADHRSWVATTTSSAGVSIAVISSWGR